MIDTVVIPCAGNGLRMSPITEILPKELLPILTTPAIDFVINECIQASIKKYIIIINKEKGILQKYLTQRFRELDFTFIIQEKVDGLGNAILLSKTFVKSSFFLVVLPDNLILNIPNLCSYTYELIKDFEIYKKPIIGISQIDLSEINLRAIVQFSEHENFEIQSITDKPLYSVDNLVYGICGRYILPSDIFSYILPVPNLKEVELTSALISYIENGNSIKANICNFPKYDIGNKEAYAKIYQEIQFEELIAATNTVYKTFGEKC